MKMEEVLRLLPHDVRGIGEEVLNAMICGPKVLSWTDKLELRSMGDVVPGTNLVHLLEYILYPEEEDSEPPRGFEQFLKGLKKIELESQWVRNASVIEELDNNEDGWVSNESNNDESDEDDTDEDEAEEG